MKVKHFFKSYVFIISITVIILTFLFNNFGGTTNGVVFFLLLASTFIVVISVKLTLYERETKLSFRKLFWPITLSSVGSLFFIIPAFAFALLVIGLSVRHPGSDIILFDIIRSVFLTPFAIAFIASFVLRFTIFLFYCSGIY